MSFCLVVQKDTLENDKVKSVVRVCGDSQTPQEFVQELQTGHCIEYQLLAYSSNSPDLVEQVNSLITPFKTNFGRDWYEFNHTTLSGILTIFLEHCSSTVDLRSISQIMGFSLKLFPIVTKEIRVSSLNSEVTEVEEDIINLLENLQVPEKSDLPRRKKEVKKDSKKVRKDN